MEELIAILLALGTGTALFTVWRRRGSSPNYRALAGEAAPLLNARASLGAGVPELRFEHEGTTVTLKLAARSSATAKLEEGAERLRIFIGWDVPEIPEGLAHFPEIALPVAYTFAGTMTTRANERAEAERFLEKSAQDLIDLRNDSGASSLAVIVRGGHIEILLNGIKPQPEAVEVFGKTTARLAKKLRVDERSAPQLPAERRCSACMDRGGEDWVACVKCRAPYHRACHVKAGGCVIPGCGELSAEPLA